MAAYSTEILSAGSDEAQEIVRFPKFPSVTGLLFCSSRLTVAGVPIFITLAVLHLQSNAGGSGGRETRYGKFNFDPDGRPRR